MATVTSIIALVFGLLMLQVGARDIHATIDVSGEAINAIVDTVDVVEDATSEIRSGLDAAAYGVSGVSATAVAGAENIEELATFLETNLEAISGAMPAAIQAAGAIDGALRALSFVGVSYSPEQPFDESLPSPGTALADLPDDLRTQSELLRELVPAATGLAGQADRLSLALGPAGNRSRGPRGCETVGGSPVCEVVERCFRERRCQKPEFHVRVSLSVDRCPLLVAVAGEDRVGYQDRVRSVHVESSLIPRCLA